MSESPSQKCQQHPKREKVRSLTAARLSRRSVSHLLPIPANARALEATRTASKDCALQSRNERLVWICRKKWEDPNRTLCITPRKVWPSRNLSSCQLTWDLQSASNTGAKSKRGNESHFCWTQKDSIVYLHRSTSPKQRRSCCSCPH